jgi:heme exporter protein C
MQSLPGLRTTVAAAPYLALAGLLAAAVLAIFVFAPTEQSMGQAQRILYLHVSVAWAGLVAFLLVAGAGALYLLRRDLAWDHWAAAAAEVGWLCSTLTLVTGSLWARAAWNTWWTWDPRLTATAVLWAIYCAYLILRSGLEDPHHRARAGAVLATIGLIDLPMVAMATRWFRGIHPPPPQMEPAMRVTLLLSAVAFTGLFGLLVCCRRRQLQIQEALLRLDEDSDS